MIRRFGEQLLFVSGLCYGDKMETLKECSWVGEEKFGDRWNAEDGD